jgi:hypothetical protein
MLVREAKAAGEPGSGIGEEEIHIGGTPIAR